MPGHNYEGLDAVFQAASNFGIPKGPRGIILQVSNAEGL